ncbi:hypothetical protein A9Q86_12350 [Flavobacteriales bacterium 33_180_T64]|nr:hypothetical protein A9Q86_12350 [Flavobacteriales bacterium 33_180_T64]
MLSVLIPVFNYDIRSLVTTVHKQLVASSTPFEIICIDDCSKTHFSTLNSEVQQLSNITYSIAHQNKGRVATRQELAKSAAYDWLLFLDADVMPKPDNFIEQYIGHLGSKYKAIYGGITYENTKPDSNFMLRWTYGKAKEELSANYRNSNTYKSLVSANFLIQKSIFTEHNVKIRQKGYGYDNYFGTLLKANTTPVLHIDNAVYHLGLESNTIYLNKIEAAVNTLLKLNEQGQLNDTDNSLLNTFKRLKIWKVNYFFSWLYKAFYNQFKNNLLGDRPRIFIIQCYKLSYICYQDLNS